MKSDQIQEYKEIEGILFYQGRIAPENQLKIQDLDGCTFFDFMEIGQHVPVVLEDSPSFTLILSGSIIKTKKVSEVKMSTHNNYRSLEGSGIKLNMASNLIASLERNRELYCEWYRIF